jgi:transcriptional regulator with XRE-family HTH domain
MSGKDVSNVRFGRALASSRKAQGMTQDTLARALGCSKSHVSNLERGDRKMSIPDVQTADRTVGAKGRLVKLHRDLYEGPGPDWLDKLADLQRESELIRESHPSLIPGLLQTTGYAEAVIAAGTPWNTNDVVKTLAEARIARGKRILGADTPHYHVVIDETAVTRPVGDRATMREQLAELHKLAASGRVVLQIHPFRAWPHHGLDGPFSLLTNATAPDVVHVESAHRGQTSDEPATVRRYAMIFGRLQASAMSPVDTVDYLRKAWEEHKHDD